MEAIHFEKEDLTISVSMDIDTTDLDKAIEKANRLAELLREAQQIIDSLT